MSEAPDSQAFDGREFVRELTVAPGVYRMLAADGSALYVGKAMSLKKRVSSYFRADQPSPRIAAMVAQIASIQITVTRTAGEALLLENQLIKSLKPRYNVQLRDDKSYPYILLTDETWPRIAFHRGGRAQPGRYFGPYPGAGAVRESMDLMQKIFRLRSCEDSVFRNRSRPCLQHQIGRCSAPCVGLVAPRDYDASVQRAALFLEGRSDELVEELGKSMDAASARLEFEQAATLRDAITTVRRVTARQHVEGEFVDMDVLACAMAGGTACVLLLSFRNGMNQGTRPFFPRLNGADNPEEVLEAFVGQYYLEKRPPREIVLSHAIPEIGLYERVFSENAGRKVELKPKVRGERARFLQLAQSNAEHALFAQVGSAAAQSRRLASLQELVGLGEAPRRIECFDISHTMGELAVASCVVFNEEGPVRAQYRRFNIAGITPGDDYAAMHQALTRRFKRGVAEGLLPDLLLIDGGAGQLAQAQAVLEELGVQGVAMVGVAKGEERRAGHETLVFPDGREIQPGIESPGLQLIQQVRDEAHRFAITGHRGRRAKARETSRLEDIAGIGPRRRANLLKHFGGLVGLKNAGVEEIARVEGVNLALAKRIYASLHGLDMPDATEPP
jgi:excinuclease ABC subunit C